MDDVAKVSRRGARQLVELPEAFEVEGSEVRVRRDGRNLVLEPIAEAAGLAPGSYTAETLPPLSEGARRILASVDAAVAGQEAGRSAKFAAAADESGFTLEDEGEPGLTLSDDGLPGIDPGR